MTSIVAITGASGTVGRAIALAFAARGNDVALLSRDAQALETVAAEVRGHAVRALVVPVDVVDPDAVEAAVARVEDELGPVETWVNAAYTPTDGLFDDLTPEEFRRAVDVGYLGAVHCTMAVLDRMREREHGLVVHVVRGSTSAAAPGNSAFAASQFALRGFTEAVSAELLADDSPASVITVELLAPTRPEAVVEAALLADR